MRRVVFIGNCQVQSLSQLYRRFADRAREEQISYLPSYEDLNDDRVTMLADADIIIEQRMDVAPRAEIDGIPTTAERHFVPLLAGGFLWPFAGQPHPRNERLWFLPSGPFDGEMSDSYLNRLFEKDVPPAEAVSQYLALDVNKVRNLDRMFEIIIDRQRSRDEACGFQIAGIIEQYFHDEPMFRTPHHPNLRVALAFATQFFQLMRVGSAGIARLHERVRITPFPKAQLPIHPSVARHFNLKYADAHTRYRIREEGRQTFAQYAFSYMCGQWNRDLVEGIAMAPRDLRQALAQMEAGLQRSPDSPEGWYSFAEALRRSGRPAEAETAARRAIALDPTEGRHYYGLGHTLAELGRLDEAADAANRALALDPFDPHFYGLSANLAARRGQAAEAEALLRRAIAVDPDSPHLLNLLADILMRLDRPDEAVAAVQRAIALQPDSAGFHFTHSRILARAGRAVEAVAAARQAAELEPDNVPIQSHLSSLLVQSDAPQDAEARLRTMIAANPDQAGLYEQLGHVLARLGRPEEAETAFVRAAELAPQAAGPLVGLSHALARLGRHHESIAAIEAAIEFQPDVAAFHLHLGNQLWIVEELGKAKAAFVRSLALDPANRDAQKQLGGLRSTMETVGLAAG